VSLWQLRVGSGQTREGWSREELFADRQKAARAALHLVRRSINACRALGPDAALNAYASGRCDRGQEAGQKRLSLARRLLAAHPPQGI